MGKPKLLSENLNSVRCHFAVLSGVRFPRKPLLWGLNSVRIPQYLGTSDQWSVIHCPKDPFPGYRLFPQGIWGLCGSRTIYNRFEMLNLFWTYFNIIRVTVLGFINIFIFKNIYLRNKSVKKYALW